MVLDRTGRETPVSEADARVSWHALDATEVLGRLGSGSDGLTSGEAERRLATYGPNALHREDRWRTLRLLLGQLQNQLLHLLLERLAIIDLCLIPHV